MLPSNLPNSDGVEVAPVLCRANVVGDRRGRVGYFMSENRALYDQRFVIVTGKGNCFSAGADFRAQIQREDTGRALQAHERSFEMYRPFLSVLDIEVPTIAAMNGHAVGGGFGLSLVCDLRIANEDAKYGANFGRLGLHPGMAISYLLPRIIGVPRAAELLFTGRLIRGHEAAEMGLANRAVAADEVMPQAMAMAREIAAKRPAVIRAAKECLNGIDPVDVNRSYRFEQGFTFELNLTGISDEARDAFLDEKKPGS